MPVHVDVGASTAGRVQELESSPLSVEKDLHALHAKRHTRSNKQSQLLDVCKSLVGQATVLGAEFCAAQAELENLSSQCDGECTLEYTIGVD